MGAIARGIFHERNRGGRLARWLREAEIPQAGGPEAGIGRHTGVGEEAEVSVRGVIRSGDVSLLTHYGTAYGLYDFPTAGYDCALKSDAYRLGEYVGDYVEVTGPLAGAGKELPVMNVTRLQLLKMKWMR